MAKAQSQRQSYKELSDELTRVLDDLQRGDLDIDEAVKSYERGLVIVKELEQHLQETENKVQRLKADALEDLEEE